MIWYSSSDTEYRMSRDTECKIENTNVLNANNRRELLNANNRREYKKIYLMVTNT